MHVVTMTTPNTHVTHITHILLPLLMVLVTHSAQAVQARWPWEGRSHRPVTPECVRGRGLSYRGTVSVSGQGLVCANWNRIVNVYSTAYYRKGLGPHNYCRNPGNNRAPYCWVQEGGRWVKQFCSLPRCFTPKPMTPTTTATPTATPTTTPTATPTTIATTPATGERDTEFTCGERQEVGRHFKIVGGSYSTVTSHPWVASIFHKRSGFRCGGSLIAPCWVLSAAHCFGDITDSKVKLLSVHLGKNAINETNAGKEQSFSVTQLILHKGYEHTGRDFNHDIALLRIEGPGGKCAVRTETVRAVCLPPAHTRLPPGSSCTIAGYGRDHTNAFTRYLKEGQVLLRQQSVCVQTAPEPEKVTDNMLCAASPDWNTDACQGDSGGPLVCEVSGRMFLFGIVSFGQGCSERGQPGFYTRVTNYNKWVAMQPDLQPYTQGAMYPQKW
ncbi:urokinase-type plasminogen activator-like [Alosa sapidissima]|uniref:urokinase-type plasminogen activator-like n=1 Tax=Alosa sapidissima TaxID=34773 RepID=UPI001C087D08|nr:urokinase-type plasminogen activator-like [Alosa sapidissima]XP_041921538.1 urokinase-type plasminogen activator-like [Alosa sapidissima]XP_041921539.1 urokinase-type plasminogen activator-like [Alosa sapidissima]